MAKSKCLASLKLLIDVGSPDVEELSHCKKLTWRFSPMSLESLLWTILKRVRISMPEGGVEWLTGLQTNWLPFVPCWGSTLLSDTGGD